MCYDVVGELGSNVQGDGSRRARACPRVRCLWSALVCQQAASQCHCLVECHVGKLALLITKYLLGKLDLFNVCVCVFNWSHLFWSDRVIWKQYTYCSESWKTVKGMLCQFLLNYQYLSLTSLRSTHGILIHIVNYIRCLLAGSSDYLESILCASLSLAGWCRLFFWIILRSISLLPF